jgi:hypothetical protein
MEHYTKCIEGKVLELFKKRGTVVNGGEARFRFRKPSLYPTELRDRRARCWRGRSKTLYQSERVIAEHAKPCFSPGGSAEPSGTPPTQAALFAAGWASTMTRDLNSSAVMTSAVEKARTVKVLRWTSSADSEPCPTSG